MSSRKGLLKKIILSIIGIIVLFAIVVIVNLKLFERNWSIVSKGQPIKNYGERNCALLVIDIQEATTLN